MRTEHTPPNFSAKERIFYDIRLEFGLFNQDRRRFAFLSAGLFLTGAAGFSPDSFVFCLTGFFHLTGRLLTG